jgi:hypothetical protein
MHLSHLPVNPIELLLREKQLQGLNDSDSDIGQESTHSFGSSSYRAATVMSLNSSIGRRVSGPSATFGLQAGDQSIGKVQLCDNIQHYGKHFESGRHRQKRRETAAKSSLDTLKHFGNVENHKMENIYR